MASIGPYRRTIRKPDIGRGHIFTPAKQSERRHDITSGQAAALKKKLAQEHQKTALIGAENIMDMFMEKTAAPAIAKGLSKVVNSKGGLRQGSNIKSTSSKTVKQEAAATAQGSQDVKDLPESYTAYRSGNSTDRLQDQQIQTRI